MVEFTTPQMGMAGVLAIMLFVLLGYEYRIPPLFTLVLVPLVVGVGLGAALVIHLAFDIGMTASLALVYGFVLVGIIAFEKATS
jgi:hypothetical protein